MVFTLYTVLARKELSEFVLYFLSLKVFLKNGVLRLPLEHSVASSPHKHPVLKYSVASPPFYTSCLTEFSSRIGFNLLKKDCYTHTQIKQKTKGTDEDTQRKEASVPLVGMNLPTMEI